MQLNESRSFEASLAGIKRFSHLSQNELLDHLDNKGASDPLQVLDTDLGVLHEGFKLIKAKDPWGTPCSNTFFDLEYASKASLNAWKPGTPSIEDFCSAAQEL
jgi:hypothetical protein